MEFLYRGVHFGHPARASALNGEVVPGDIFCTVSPEQHNRGGWSATSPYTSWTPNETLAKTYACSLKGHGPLLRVLETEPLSEDKWRWVRSPNHYEEDEVLLYGVRLNVEVVERELLCR